MPCRDHRKASATPGAFFVAEHISFVVSILQADAFNFGEP